MNFIELMQQKEGPAATAGHPKQKSKTKMNSNFTATEPVHAPQHQRPAQPALKWSMFASVQSTRSCEPHTGTWAELVAQVKKPKRYATKADQPLIKLATFGSKPNAKGSVRYDGILAALRASGLGTVGPSLAPWVNTQLSGVGSPEPALERMAQLQDGLMALIAEAEAVANAPPPTDDPDTYPEDLEPEETQP